MFLLELLQHRFLTPGTSDDGAVSFDNDIVFLCPLDDVVAREPRVDFPLADVDLGAVAGRIDVLLEFIEMVDTEIRDAY
jgi:hypothetical protein